jgi:hypothetical protein
MIESLEIRRIGTREIQLPSFMATLPQVIIDEIFEYDSKVISCGVDPQDGGLYMVTSTSQVKVLRPNGHMLPIDSFPSHDGELIAVSFKSIDGYYGIGAKAALNAAEDCITSAGLFVNDTYMCDLQLSSVDVVPGQDEDNIK